MASSPSPFFTNPAWGAGVSNLAKAFGEPGDAELADQRRAAAEHSRALTGEVTRRGSSADAMSQRMREGGITPQAQAALLAEGVRSGNPAMVGQLSDLMRTFVFSQQPDAATGANAFQGAGGSYANTQPGFQQHDGTLRRNQDVQTGGTVQSARIGAGATMGAAGIRARTDQAIATQAEGGRNSRFLQGDVNPGADGVYLGPQRSQALGFAQPGSLGANFVPGGANVSAGASRIAPEPGPVSGPVRTQTYTAPAAPDSSAAARPITVDGNETKAIGEQIDAQSVDDQGPFTFAPQARQAVGLRATELFREGPLRGNMPGAVKAAIDEYRRGAPRTDNSMNPFSERTFGTRPAAGAAPAAPKPGSVVRQNGRNFVIQPDGSARPAS